MERILLVIFLIFISANLYYYFNQPDDLDKACYRSIDGIKAMVNELVNKNHEAIDMTSEQLWKKLRIKDGDYAFMHKKCLKCQKVFNIKSDGKTILIYCPYHGKYTFNVQLHENKKEQQRNIK